MGGYIYRVIPRSKIKRFVHKFESSQGGWKITNDIIDGSVIMFTVSSEEALMTFQTNSIHLELFILQTLVFCKSKNKFKLKTFGLVQVLFLLF